MIEPQDVQNKLLNGLQEATVEVQDLTGTRDHYRVLIVSDVFEGRSLLQRHQMINEVLREELKGPIHALTIQAHTKSEWQTKNGAVPSSSKPQAIKL